MSSLGRLESRFEERLRAVMWLKQVPSFGEILVMRLQERLQLNISVAFKVQKTAIGTWIRQQEWRSKISDFSASWQRWITLTPTAASRLLPLVDILSIS